MTLDDLHPLAREVADLLLVRGERLAVIDGATGGLVSAALLTVPGATKFYRGGGVLYSLKGREVMLGLPREAYAGMVSATPEYALLQARGIAARLRCNWGFAESGSVGGSVHPLGVDAGKSCAAVAGPGIERTRITETISDARIANMWAFTHAGLMLLRDALSEAA
jgi:nicotinamide mononucleotide (NMN) deamidase PncC